jgi:hypothetical protein
MDFCYALNALREGKKVSRSGWNGKGMYVFLRPGQNEITSTEDPGRDPSAKSDENGNVEMKWLPFLVMKTVQGEYVPWLISQTDALATDWGIV